MTFAVTVPLGGSASATSPNTASAVVADPVLVAAGDIACAPDDPNFAGTNPSTCQMRATAQQIASIAPQYLLPIGDTQYASGGSPQGVQPSLADYHAGYDATWGAINAPGMTVRPVPGNHEYGSVTSTTGLASGSNYFKNFGPNGLQELPPTVTNASNDFYSYDIPVSGGSSWHVIALDSECTAPGGGCAAGSPQESWLRNDLAAHPNTCTLAYWHRPRWGGSTGPSGNSSVAAFWNDLTAARATLVLNGHDHYYQDLTALDANGAPSANGVRQFIVGTGGEDLEVPGAPGPTVLNQDYQHFGVLKLTLHGTSASYAYQSTNGAMPDSGTVNCTNTAPAAAAPTVSSVTPISGAAAGGTAVAVTGTNFAAGSTVAFGGVPATNVQVNSTTSLTATAPAFNGSPGASTVDITVATSGGTSVGNPADQFTYTLATNGYSATLVASTTTPPVGGSVTLTATANQDLSPTPYGLSIVDAATNTQLAHSGSGSATVVVSQAAASQHRYIARVDNVNGANTQAVSTPVVVTWGNPAPPPGPVPGTGNADLSLGLSTPLFAAPGPNSTTVVTVTNNGPSVAGSTTTTVGPFGGENIAGADGTGAPTQPMTSGQLVFTTPVLAVGASVSYPIAVSSPQYFHLGGVYAYTLATNGDPNLFNNIGLTINY